MKFWNFFHRERMTCQHTGKITLSLISFFCLVMYLAFGCTPLTAGEKSGKKAGERMVKTIDGIDYAFRWCPAGEFMMGSPEDELGREEGETQHRVTLTKGFWMLETEVTQEMWKSVMGNNPSHFKGSNLPVERVSWEDCQDFCQKLRSQGLNVQLPTEAQWEYACRAGTTTSLNNGKNITTSKVDICDNLDEVGWYLYGGMDSRSHPVGQKKPNAWGLYDMHGNVLEWCQDWSGDYPSGSVTDPTGPTSGTYRVSRGGCWLNSVRFCRSAPRCNFRPSARNNYLGLRLILQTEEAKQAAEKREEEARKRAAEEAKSLVDLSNQTSGLEAGTRIVGRIYGVECAFRWCPAGEFMMGSPEGDLRRKKNKTQHRVTLTKGFWMLETEVTQAMWESVMGYNPSHFKGSNLPVERVSWENCQDFCQKLRSLGLNVQLPTEAQWEYACRAGTTTSLNSGKNITSEDGDCSNLNEAGWYRKNSDDETHPVGQKRPNAWGLYDMHGNVWEWCQDWYGDYPSGSVTDPTGPTSGTYRVIRGGSWRNFAERCRSAIRLDCTPTVRGNNLGLRLALVP
ncbi:MAG: formylglycine-generating enzyme family protein [Planctomycetia bacterium]|nr:formylglycine-generating enzyme family protein [Planctomycetia bacterium]